MDRQERIMEYFTSPAARRPYPGTKAAVHTMGLMMVIHRSMWRQREALSSSSPARLTMGPERANRRRQLAVTTTSAAMVSFLI